MVLYSVCVSLSACAFWQGARYGIDNSTVDAMTIGALLYFATEWSGCDTTVAAVLIALLPTTSAAGYRILDGGSRMMLQTEINTRARCFVVASWHKTVFNCKLSYTELNIYSIHPTTSESHKYSPLYQKIVLCIVRELTSRKATARESHTSVV